MDEQGEHPFHRLDRQGRGGDEQGDRRRDIDRVGLGRLDVVQRRGAGVSGQPDLRRPDLQYIPVVELSVGDWLMIDSHAALTLEVDHPDPVRRVHPAAMIVRDTGIDQPDLTLGGASDQGKAKMLASSQGEVCRTPR